jgi:hypothetical protein
MNAVKFLLCGVMVVFPWGQSSSGSSYVFWIAKKSMASLKIVLSMLVFQFITVQGLFTASTL